MGVLMLRGKSLTARIVGVIAAITGTGAMAITVLAASFAYVDGKSDAVAEARADAATLAHGFASLLSRSAQVTRELDTSVKVTVRRPEAARELVLERLRQTLAREPRISGVWMIAEPNGLDGRDAQNRGAFGSTQSGEFFPYWRRTANGQIVQDSLGQRPNTSAERMGPFYVEPRDRNRLIITQPFRYRLDEGAGPEVLMASVAAPVRVAGRLVGVVGVDLFLDDLSTQLAGRAGAGREFVVVSDIGVIAAASDKRLLGLSVSELGLGQAAWSKLKRGEGAVVSGGWRGERSIVVGETLEFDGDAETWVLLAAEPTANVFAETRNIILAIVLIGLLFGAVAVFFALRLGRTLSRPVVEMARVMRKMADGDLTAPTPVVPDWAAELTDMAAAIEYYRRCAGELMEAEAARRAAEHAAAERSNFLAVMSHEIRTPLNGVLGMAQALAATPLNGEQREMVQVILRSGDNVVGLLTDFLDISKINAGKLELALEPFAPSGLISDTVELFRAQARAKGVEMTLELRPLAGRWFEADAARIRQILLNLVSNAVKFTEAGEVQVRAKAPGRGGRRELTIVVEDTGPGISAELQGHLFSPFVQADTTTTRKHGGTGLGLSVSRELARLMGGDITVDSAPGQGARFTLTLPVSVAAAPAAVAPEPEPVAPGRLRVLAADDNSANQQVLGALLGQIDAEVTFAGDGAEALRLWTPGAFDLVLMDLRMPVMNGWDAVREIRRREAALNVERTPVLAVSANTAEDDLHRCAASGFDGAVAKPIRVHELYAAIGAALIPQDAAAPQSGTAAA